MKFRKSCLLLASMSVLALIFPLSVHSGHGPATYASPGDDQPWGGEIDGRDYDNTPGTISSVADDTPARDRLPVFEFIGTPLVLFDIIRFDFYTQPVTYKNCRKADYVKKEDWLFSRESKTSVTRYEKSSVRKGR